jgi:trans-aconitate 2-methyltransferase
MPVRMTNDHERATDWNSTAYHRVSAPQLEWGSALLESFDVEAPDLVLDIGCGTGRVTLELLERVHAARVVAVDLSPAMIAAARSFLSARVGRVNYVQADAIALPFERAADVIFSTATFHWINDHERLFRSLYAALKKPGRLIAQCGGGPNLARFRETCASVMRLPALAPFFSEWSDPWEFADADIASRRLREAGFVNVRTQVFPTPLVHGGRRNSGNSSNT